jgi:hypothetical protein
MQASLERLLRIIGKAGGLGFAVLVLVCSGASSLWSLPPGRSPVVVLPFLGKPTSTSVTINLAAPDRLAVCAVRYRREGAAPEPETWKQSREVTLPSGSAAEITLEPLVPGSVYQYEVLARLQGEDHFSTVGTYFFRTRPEGPSPFSFALVSDAHLTPGREERSQVLSAVCASVRTRSPAFFMMLGDNVQTFTSHGGPMGDPRHGPLLYLLLRRALGDLSAFVPGFLLLGNWEGENGWHPDRERTWARQARMDFTCNPDATTYPEGGSINEDYFAFTWGNALFVGLTVTRYTTTDHALGSPVGKQDDWTLGEQQREWLLRQLAGSKARWKMLFIHHTVGGKGGDELNSRYGRGGGRAAKVGEQALIHDWMRRYGAQVLFYGHDHVFTDMKVDGIHYICVGSAGAPWKFGQAETGYDRFWTPSGYTWVDVAGEALRVSFVRPDTRSREGVVLHSFDIS